MLTSERLACENCMKADIAPFGASLSFLALFLGCGLDDPLGRWDNKFFFHR